MLSVIIVIHLMLVLGLIGVVLLQKSEGGGLVSSTSGFMTGRSTANLLTRTTAILAVAFFATSVLLVVLSNRSSPSRSLLDQGPPPSTQEAPAAPAAPVAPATTPAAPAEPTTPPAPSAPSAPLAK